MKKFQPPFLLATSFASSAGPDRSGRLPDLQIKALIDLKTRIDSSHD
ncbi:MAG: hypothetical protein RLZZ214_4185 [Verrucomicrobiota bacterium]|jgi:hypothetical protein